MTMNTHPQTLSALPDEHSLRSRICAGLDKLAEAWRLWVTVGATGGALMLSPSLLSTGDVVPHPMPSAFEIERAVAQAEAQGIAAGADIKPRFD
jgi:hypothetical protein